MAVRSRMNSGLIYQLIAAAIFVVTLWVVGADVEAGMNDDWSYVRTVQELAATGQLHYNGWAAPLIGFEAYWGALFVKVFGFSFLAVRASAWVLTMMAIPVFWELLRSVELSEEQAFFGLLTFLLSPLCLPNLATFMTDMPAFFLFATALLAAMKAWEAADERLAMWWVCATTVCGILSGSVRQIYWLSGICFLVVLGIARLRWWRGRVFIVACIGVTIAFGGACSGWLAIQPYVPADTTAQAWRQLSWRLIAHYSIGDIMRGITELAVLLMPMMLPLGWLEKRRGRFWIDLVILFASVAMAYRLAQPLPFLGNTITPDGVTASGTLSVGDKPEVISYHSMVLLAGCGLASAVYAIWMAVQRLRHRGTGLARFTALTTPFLLGYVAVTSIRSPAFGMYDRYLIPLLFIGATMALGAYSRFERGVSAAAWATAAIFACYAIATTHDYFSDARAKLDATNRVLSAGIRREAILSGFEYDLWTQLVLAGHVNSKLVKFPKDAYRQSEDCNGDDDVQVWWRPMAPALRARYVISLTPLTDLQTTKFPRVEYWRWLPVARSYVYTQKVNGNDAPLTCELGSGD